MGSSSLCTFQAMVTTAASSAAAAAPPFALRCRGSCFVPPPQRWRPRAARCQGGSRGMDPHASPPPPPPPVKARRSTKLMPATVVKVGAGVALAMALGGVSWSWTVAARDGSACPVLPPPPPSLVCVLNGASAGGAPMDKRLLRDFIDKLSSSLRNNKLRGKLPRDTARLTKGLKEQFSKTKDVDQGVDLTEAWILTGNWKEAEATCQNLTNLYPQDPRPRLLSIVINVTQAMEALLSADSTTSDNDIEEMTSKINEMTKDAIDAWKKNRKDHHL